MAGMNTQNALDKSLKAQKNKLSPQWINWQYYSSVVAGSASSTANLNWFQDSVASVGYGKTNMDTPAQLNSGKYFRVKEILIRIFNRDGTPMRMDNSIAYTPNLLMATFFGRFTINNVEMFQFHGLMFHEAQERVDAATTVGAGAVNTIPYRSIKFDAPIQINPQTSFGISGQCTTPAATGGYSATSTEIMFILKGQLRRSI